MPNKNVDHNRNYFRYRSLSNMLIIVGRSEPKMENMSVILTREDAEDLNIIYAMYDPSIGLERKQT